MQTPTESMQSQIEQLFIDVDSVSDVAKVLAFVETCNKDSLLVTHRDGRNLLHKAIQSLNTDLIEALITKNRQLLFTVDAHGFNPLTYALKQYINCRSMTSKTVANQVYFKLHKGQERNDAVNIRVNVHEQFELVHDRLWQHGLELCFRRDAGGRIVDVDKDWIDFVVQVVDDGLTVDYGLIGGAKVNRNVMLWWVEREYPRDAYLMFRSAVNQQSTGLAARTISQMTHNAHLTQSKELMQRANLKLPYLKKMDSIPNQVSQDADTLVYCTTNNTLYYQDKTSVTAIDTTDFIQDKQDSYERLIAIFSSAFTSNRQATFEEAMHVFNIKPLPIVSEPEPVTKPNSVRSLRSLGMFKPAPTPRSAVESLYGDPGL